jgi:hypothetical protein
MMNPQKKRTEKKETEQKRKIPTYMPDSQTRLKDLSRTLSLLDTQICSRWGRETMVVYLGTSSSKTPIGTRWMDGWMYGW